MMQNSSRSTRLGFTTSGQPFMPYLTASRVVQTDASNRLEKFNCNNH